MGRLDGKVAIKPHVEMRPLADINDVFAAAARHAPRRRAVLVPA